jgi:peptidoglycan/xylan/chitin deacetylase (PgdA/CDA1 family)
MELCLSFDNGPEPEATPGVLEVLARRRIPEMFFVIGEKLRDPRACALVQQARDAGHVIGNHTLTHGAPLGRRGAAEALHEIAETDVLVSDLAAPERYFRPNGGGGALGRCATLSGAMGGALGGGTSLDGALGRGASLGGAAAFLGGGGATKAGSLAVCSASGVAAPGTAPIVASTCRSPRML